ncbi:MAG: SET domain-containing protein [Patescibacteria group bacterium]
MFLLPRNHYQIKSADRKGRGVFARREIPAGTIIGDYLGRLMPEQAAARLEKNYGYACYAMDYDDNGLSIFPVDVKAPGVHLINHGCTPNCDSYYYLGHTLYFALRRIFPGEELTVDYSFDPESEGAVIRKDLLHHCACGSPLCRGTMYTSTAKLKRYGRFCREQAKKQPKFELLRAGMILPPLAEYPKQIKDFSYYDIFASLRVRPVLSRERIVPDLRSLRQRLRIGGRPIRFSRLRLTIWGIAGRQLWGLK